MRLKVPFTGTVLDYDPEAAQIDGLGISGDPDDPIQLIDIDLGEQAWRLISLDLEAGLAEIEITADARVKKVRDGGKDGVEADWIDRPTTEQEKQALLDYARSQVEPYTKDQLFIRTQSARPTIPEQAKIKHNTKILSWTKDWDDHRFGNAVIPDPDGYMERSDKFPFPAHKGVNFLNEDPAKKNKERITAQNDLVINLEYL